MVPRGGLPKAARFNDLEQSGTRKLSIAFHSFLNMSVPLGCPLRSVFVPILEQRRCCLRPDQTRALDDIWRAHEIQFDVTVSLEGVSLFRQETEQFMVRHSGRSVSGCSDGW